ncbi:MAG: DUF1559 domain-containing protein [bacterium]|nr:DUF1559 domain-containing protein [bacterium]
MSKRNGFTLIELLVVIAIIALLIAILFPVFSKARENARKATCQSNIKQLGMVINMYVQDYDEFFPPRTNGTGTTYLWTQRLSAYGADYAKRDGILYCPSADSSVASIASNLLRNYPGYGALTHGPLCWPANGAGGVYSGTTASYPPACLAQILDPARTILLAEQRPNGAGTDPNRGVYTINNYNNTATSFPGRHLGMDNIVFVDGHVEAKDVVRLNQWLRDNNRGRMEPFTLDF